MQIPLISTLLTTLLPSQLKTPDNALLPYIFDPIPLGSIKPQGWMLDQLQLMADGLAGHQYDFYRFVKDSSWIGGDQEYSTLNEAWPYWFNSIVPLAYALDDTRLKQQVQSSVDYLLEHQFADGWIGPESNVQYRMFWPRTLVLMGLTQYLEAEPNQAPRVLPHLYRYMNLTRSMLQDDYLGYVGRPDSKFDYRWGITRSQDMIISLQWLYDYYPEGNEQLLLDIMNLFNEKAWDWAYFYSEKIFPKKDLELFPIADDPNEDLFWYYHGVNSAMGLKALPVVRRLTHNDTLLEITRRGVNWTFEYHGSPSGSIIGDEPWSGLSPTRGSELCTAVEAMYSLAYNYRAIGDWEFADRAELAAFNALPGGVSSDWWSHQYVTQINQPYSQDLIETPFNNVNSLGQTFGLEPDYPCCTVNHPQGFPKFLAASYVKVGNDGIGHALLTPSKLTTTLKQNNEVSIDCQTIYPFGNTLTYTITADSPFNFFVRIPQWVILSTSTLKINSNSHQALKPDSTTGMHKISLPAGKTKIAYTFNTEIKVVPRARDTVAIYHGALLYAIPIAGHAHATPPRDYRSHKLIPEKWTTPLANDYTINNTTSWNIAIDPTTLKFATAATDTDFPLPNPIFSWSEEGEGPPTTITGMGCEIEWGSFKGAPADPPLERKCLGEIFKVTMVPYGAAKLHMAELPTVRFEEKAEL